MLDLRLLTYYSRTHNKYDSNMERREKFDK